MRRTGVAVVVLLAAALHGGAAAAAAAAAKTIDLATPPMAWGAAAAEREAAGISRPVASHKGRSAAKQHEAEVSRLLGIVTKALSNASDDIVEERGLLPLYCKSEPGELEEGDTAKRDIKIWLEPKKKILFVQDHGIAMTRNTLLKDLGTIAHLKNGDGQMGFYSVTLVADWADMPSTHGNITQYAWQERHAALEDQRAKDREFISMLAAVVVLAMIMTARGANKLLAMDREPAVIHCRAVFVDDLMELASNKKALPKCNEFVFEPGWIYVLPNEFVRNAEDAGWLEALEALAMRNEFVHNAEPYNLPDLEPMSRTASNASLESINARVVTMDQTGMYGPQPPFRV